MKDRTVLELERHTLLCSIERCRHIVGLKRDVERLKNQLAAVDRQLDAVYDNPGAAVFHSASPEHSCSR
jgi:hypothetical protein